jgi:2-oxoglutarate dehydrogenase E2 component (dihydrolipoamide succinyltransferase)
MNILMPQLGETVTEGTIAAWHKKPGDPVKADEILIDVETDKVATEIPAPADGVLAEILVKEGETVAVGTVLAVIRTEGESEAPAVSSTQSDESAGKQAPVAVARRDRPNAGKTGAYTSPLSPAVKQLLAEHNLEPAMIPGTGRDGRVKRADILRFLELQATGTATRTGAGSTEAANFIPFNRLRRVTAEHMVRSKAASAHVLQAVEVDFSRVARAREKHSAAWKSRHGYTLTWLPFIARAVCLALRQFPRLNASVEGDGLRLHPEINLAIAVDLDHEGLMTPVIRAADILPVAELAARIHALAEKARDGKISNDDLAGGTYTISNSGSFGTLITAPIINQPQVAILSTDGIRKRPVVVSGTDGDTIAIHPVGILAQSFDHRAVDGAYSAGFLRELQSHIEETDWEAEL